MPPSGRAVAEAADFGNLGEALGTDYMLIRDQLTEDEIDCSSARGSSSTRRCSP